MMPRTLSSASRLLDCSQLPPTTGGDSCTALFEQLHSAARTHRDVQYQRAELDQLRQLPHPQGHRSLYGSDGLIPGSQRLERWLLWPSGVKSAGAMRQWGRHATAFIGRAHFDEPDLLERYFPQP